MLKDYTEIDLPLNSEILNAKMVNNEIVMYALVLVVEKPLISKYCFKVLFTGQKCEDIDEYKYLNTITNNLVFHVFYKNE